MAPAEDKENGRRASSSPPSAPLPAALCPAGPALASPDCQTLEAANPSSPRVEPRVAALEVAPDVGIVAQGEEYWSELDGQNQLPAIENEVGVQSLVDWDALQIVETVDDEGRLEEKKRK
ncbi:hypothetical protein EJB05_05383, partial [Eragrostis curvula]